MVPGYYFKESSQYIDSTPQDPDPLTRVQVESIISTVFTVKMLSRNQAQATTSCSHNLVTVPILNGQLLLTFRYISRLLKVVNYRIQPKIKYSYQAGLPPTEKMADTKISVKSILAQLLHNNLTQIDGKPTHRNLKVAEK